MIGWVSPAILGALTAIGIPIVMHFIKRRPQVIVVPTLQFMPKGFRVRRQRVRLHELLLLLLRILCVTLLVLAFAHPFLRAEGATHEWEGECTLFVIDASASMRGRDAQGAVWSRIVTDVESRIAALPEGQEWRVFFYADDVFARIEPTNAWRTVLREWEARVPTYGGTDYNTLWRHVRAFLDAYQGRVRVVWYTDLQEDALAALTPQTLPDTAFVEVVPYMPEPAQVVLSFEAPLFATRAGVESTLYFTLQGAPRRADVTVYVNDTRVAAEIEPTPARGEDVYAVHLPPYDEGIHIIRAEVAADDTYDITTRDTAVLYVQRPWRVGIVSSSPVRDTVLSKTVYLATALTTLVAETTWPVAPEIFHPDALETQDLSQYAALLFVDIGVVSSAAIEAVDRYVQNGGGLLVFSGEHMSPEWYNTRLLPVGLMPARVVFPTAVAEDGGYTHMRLGTWDSTHPALQWAETPYADHLRQIHFTRIMRSEPLPDATVVASFDTGAPALVSRPHGDGLVALLTTSADREWTTLPRSRLYVPFIRHIVRWVAQRPDVEGNMRTAVIRVQEEEDITRAPGIVFVDEADNIYTKYSVASGELAGRHGMPTAVQTVLGVSDDAFHVVMRGGQEGRRDALLSWLVVFVCALVVTEGIYANSVSYV